MLHEHAEYTTRFYKEKLLIFKEFQQVTKPTEMFCQLYKKNMRNYRMQFLRNYQNI